MHDEIKQNLGETGKHFQAVTQDEVEKVFEVSSCHLIAFYLSWAKDLVILHSTGMLPVHNQPSITRGWS